jgi:tetratricopeptide (TPR) repeat protein
MVMEFFEPLFQCESRGDISRLVLILGGTASTVTVIAGLYRLWRWFRPIERHRIAAGLLRGEGENRARQKEWGKARVLYDCALRLRPRSAHTFYLRGLTYEQTGPTARAIADWKRAVQILPTHRAAQRKLADHATPRQTLVAAE